MDLDSLGIKILKILKENEMSDYPNYEEAANEIMETIGLDLNEAVKRKIELIVKKYADQLSYYNSQDTGPYIFGPGS